MFFWRAVKPSCGFPTPLQQLVWETFVGSSNYVLSSSAAFSQNSRNANDFRHRIRISDTCGYKIDSCVGD